MPRYTLTEDQTAAIQRALADRAELLADNIEDWSNNPAMEGHEDLAAAEDEEEILLALQARDLTGRVNLDRASVACVKNALAGWGEQLVEGDELAIVHELQTGPFPIPGQG